jgi:glyoxylase-like metal-dependent hydrolase (beta-lactamase superfamily II)
MMNIARFQFNPIAENTYVVWDETGEAAVIDAGNSTAAENRVLDDFFAQRGLKPVLAINTHGHFDHALGVAHLKETYGVPFAAHSADAFLLENASRSGHIFGVKVSPLPAIDIDISEREEITFGNTTLEIIPTPGHTPGHVALFEPVSRVVFTGDTLFADSIGRTDLPGGDYSWIMRSIIERLLPLGGDVRVYPGHGPDTTIGREAAGNPFITEILSGDVNFK